VQGYGEPSLGAVLAEDHGLRKRRWLATIYMVFILRRLCNDDGY
jgi:hypothetical protein